MLASLCRRPPADAFVVTLLLPHPPTPVDDIAFSPEAEYTVSLCRGDSVILGRNSHGRLGDGDAKSVLACCNALYWRLPSQCPCGSNVFAALCVLDAPLIHSAVLCALCHYRLSRKQALVAVDGEGVARVTQVCVHVLYVLDFNYRYMR